MNLTEQLLLTFVGGGVICLIAQMLIDLTRLTPARILVIYVSFGVLLYAVGAYTPLFEIFGAGYLFLLSDSAHQLPTVCVLQ